MNPAAQRLRAEVASDHGSFEHHVNELACLRLGRDADAGDLARAAIALHHAYAAVEALMVRVARWFEGSLPEGPDWHQAVLQDMALEIEGVRPSVLSISSRDMLRTLLGFRHFFRHAYAVELDGARLADLRDIAVALRAVLAEDVRRLDELLAEVARMSEEVEV